MFIFKALCLQRLSSLTKVPFVMVQGISKFEMPLYFAMYFQNKL